MLEAPKKMAKASIKLETNFWQVMTVKFSALLSSDTDLVNGNSYPLRIAQRNVKIKLNRPTLGEYRVLVMYDSTAEYFHLVVTDIESNDNMNVRLGYRVPNPPAGSGKHAYSFIYYKQRPKAVQGIPRDSSRNTSLPSFVSLNGLQEIARLTFYTEKPAGGGLSLSPRSPVLRNSKQKIRKGGENGGDASRKAKKEALQLCVSIGELSPRSQGRFRVEKFLMDYIYPEAVVVIAGFLGHKLPCPFTL